jgi:hypothetical protein
MLIPYTYVYVLIALFVVLGIALSIIGDKSPDKRTRFKALAWLLGLGGALAGIAAMIIGTKTYIFEGTSRDAITHDQLLLFGSKHVEIGGHKFDIANDDDGSLVVNATEIPLVIHTAEYSSMSFTFGNGTPDVMVASGTTTRTKHRVDNFGPNDPLPSSVSSKSSSETRVQVTW